MLSKPAQREREKLPVEKACVAIVYRGKNFAHQKRVLAELTFRRTSRKEKRKKKPREGSLKRDSRTWFSFRIFARKTFPCSAARNGLKDMYCSFSRSKTGDIVLSHEHTAFEWLDFNDSIRRVRFRPQSILAAARSGSTHHSSGRLMKMRRSTSSTRPTWKSFPKSLRLKTQMRRCKI